MNKYCVAYLSLHDGELKQRILKADSRYSALAYVLDLSDELKSEFTTEDQIYELAANWDSYISIIEI